jgi:hypothetical protein
MIPRIKRIGKFEFFAEHADEIYGEHNIGIQISLTCIAIMLWSRTFGVSYVWKKEND